MSGQSQENQAAGLLVTDFDFPLPAELIAQQPPAVRGMDRMLVVDRATGALRDGLFAEFPALLRTGRSAGPERQPRDSGAPLCAPHPACATARSRPAASK